MVLVLILLGVFIVSLLIAFLILISEVRINIKHFEFENILLPRLIYDYDIQICLYVLGKIPLIKFNINPEILRKLNVIEKLEKNHINEKVVLDFDILKKAKMAYPKIENLNFNLKIGTEDALYTSIIVFVISMIFSLGLPHITEEKNYNKIKYEINPLYAGKNLFSLKMNSIIYVKMVHIINIIYIYLRKRREEENERTSNRRSYANCDEQYPRYDRCKYNYRGTN